MKLSRIMFLSLLLLIIFPIRTEAERELEIKNIIKAEENISESYDYEFTNNINNYNSSRSKK